MPRRTRVEGSGTLATPYPCCLLFEGKGGVGKSAAAKTLIHDLGVCPFSGLVEYSASNLSIEEVRRLFGQTFRYRPMVGNPWHILLIEELELIVSRHVNAALKDELSEQHMPERLIVVATSNDASGLDGARPPNDHHQPAGEPRGVAELPQAAICLQEHVLAQVFGFVQGAARGVRNRPHQGSELVVEPGERLAIARLRPFDKFLDVRHPSPTPDLPY